MCVSGKKELMKNYNYSLKYSPLQIRNHKFEQIAKRKHDDTSLVM